MCASGCDLSELVACQRVQIAHVLISTCTRRFSFHIIVDASVLLSEKSFESVSIVFSTQLCYK